MNNLLPPIIFSALLGCAGAANEGPSRPFKDVCANLNEYSPWLRKRFVLELSKGLMSKDEADYERRDFINRRTDPPVPHWVDFVNELLQRSQRDLLVELLREQAIEEYQYLELAQILAKRRDPDLFAILMDHSAPIEVIPRDTEDRRGGYQRMAVMVLSQYLGGSPQEEVAVQRLISVLKRTCSATGRGWAAFSLRSTDRSEAVEALVQSLKDDGSVGSPNGSPEETVARCAERSLKEIEKRTGRSIPRVAP